MQREALLVSDEITESHLAAIQEVAAAMRMALTSPVFLYQVKC